VESFAHYGLEDGRIINFSDRTTPTRGREMTILQQLISNAGNVSPLPEQ
jgi:outer membrane protein assembly factor BamE (lipoprotein component of BamABCDE complex)